MNYELLYIVDAKKTDEDRKSLIEKVSALVAKNGGNVSNVDEWGIKKFAYPINYTNEGYYVLANFTMPVENVKAFTSTLNITDGVVRYMCIQK